MSAVVYRALAYGALWAIVVAAGDLTLLPVFGLDALGVLQLGGAIWSLWLPAGVATAALAGTLERRVAHLPALIAVITVALMAAAQAGWWLLRLVLRADVSGWASHPGLHYLNLHGEPLVSLSYQLWGSIFYGLPYAAALAFVLRTERHRAMLAEAELARSRAQEAASSVRLAAMRGRVDPALMLHALEESERRYRDHPQAAERLLDELVAFLRAAMPAIRAEPQGPPRLHEAHARLQARLADPTPSPSPQENRDDS